VDNAFTPFFEHFFVKLYGNALRTDYQGTNADLCLASFVALSSLFENASVNSFPTMVNALPKIVEEIIKTI
jgi:hypothetical protein